MLRLFVDGNHWPKEGLVGRKSPGRCDAFGDGCGFWEYDPAVDTVGPAIDGPSRKAQDKGARSHPSPGYFAKALNAVSGPKSGPEIGCKKFPAFLVSVVSRRLSCQNPP